MKQNGMGLKIFIYQPEKLTYRSLYFLLKILDFGFLLSEKLMFFLNTTLIFVPNTFHFINIHFSQMNRWLFCR